MPTDPMPGKSLDYAFVAIVALIVGYLLGGWVYAVAGDGVWQALENWQTLITGLLALGVGVLTVRGLSAQIAETRRQFRHEMWVATAMDRATINRETALPARQIPQLIQAIDAVKVLVAQGRAPKFLHRFKRIAQRGDMFRAWYERATLTRRLLSDEQSASLETMIDDLSDLKQAMDLPDLEDLDMIRTSVVKAGEAIDSVRSIAEKMVPD